MEFPSGDAATLGGVKDGSLAASRPVASALRTALAHRVAPSG
jgi:hypothetical protein